MPRLIVILPIHIDGDIGIVIEPDWSTGVWLNRPNAYAVDNRTLVVETDNATDFWRETYYGFVRDSGHFLGFTTPAQFTAQIHIQAEFAFLYDQAGLMLRVDAERWIKTGIELSDGHRLLSAVVTNGASDWSVAVPSDDQSSMWLRVTAQNGAVRIQTSADGLTWPLLRLAPFPTHAPMLVGPMACTPKRAGLTVRFSQLAIGPVIATDLHDLQ